MFDARRTELWRSGGRRLDQMNDGLAIRVKPVPPDAERRSRSHLEADEGAQEAARSLEVPCNDRNVVKLHDVPSLDPFSGFDNWCRT